LSFFFVFFSFFFGGSKRVPVGASKKKERGTRGDAKKGLPFEVKAFLNKKK
jgi:hypothetical protein